MKRSKKNINTTFLFSFLFCISILFPFRGISLHTGNLDGPPQEVLPKVELSFDYPDQIDAGDNFLFTINLKKKDNYQHPGVISCRFSGGLTPKQASSEFADISVAGKTVNIRWDHLSNSNIISFSIPVSTNNMLTGVYPVRIGYTDEASLNIAENVGIFIVNKKEPPATRLHKPAKENPFTVHLEHPDEILFEETWVLGINIAKGKQTGKAGIFVQLPPKSKVEVLDYNNYRVEEKSGNLYIELKNMPPGPEFTVRCKVKNNNFIKSAYPIRVSVELENNVTITDRNFIFVTDSYFESLYSSPENDMAPIPEEKTEETENLFEELDKLLDAWTKSTSKDNEENYIPSDLPPDEQKQEFDSVNAATFYRVQIVASAYELPKTREELVDLGISKELHEDFDGRIYRYTLGSFDNLQEAEFFKRKLKKLGFPDAFVVKYENGIRTKSFY
jgi:hypothetical protein